MEFDKEREKKGITNANHLVSSHQSHSAEVPIISRLLFAISLNFLASKPSFFFFFGLKMHDRAQSFVFRACVGHELHNQTVSIG